jgi:hypothetical protein
MSHLKVDICGQKQETFILFLQNVSYSSVLLAY